MRNPIYGARILGALFVIGALYDILTSEKSSYIPPQLLVILLLPTAFQIVVGLGLLLAKKWAIFALGIITLLQILVVGSGLAHSGALDIKYASVVVVLAASFIWFYSKRAKFS